LKKGLVIGVTGASGIVYALRFIDLCGFLKGVYGFLYVVYSDGAVRVASQEHGLDLVDWLRSRGCIDGFYGEGDWGCRLASSSVLTGFDGVIVPASLNTVAKLANGIQDNLLLRVFSSLIRLGNRVVVVVRETPLSSIDLLNLYRLSRNNVIVLPASPGFYTKPKSIDDLVDFIVGKIMDALGIEHDLYPRWSGSS